MDFQVYSDYSMIGYGDHRAAYAFVIIKREANHPPEVFKCGSRLLRLPHKSYVGEVMGMLAGIRALPDNAVAKALIDIDHINTLLQRNKRLLKRQYKEIAEQRNRLNQLEISYFQKAKRNGVYHWCHKTAKTKVKGHPMPKRIDEFSKEDLNWMLIPRLPRKKGWRAKIDTLLTCESPSLK